MPTETTTAPLADVPRDVYEDAMNAYWATDPKSATKRMKAAFAVVWAAARDFDALRAALGSASDQLAFHSRDWGLDSRDAWLWGILCGWDEGGATGAMDEHIARFGWGEDAVTRLRQHRAAIVEITAEEIA